MALHRPGQARTERFVEGFNGRLRDECLSDEAFTGLAARRSMIER